MLLLIELGFLKNNCCIPNTGDYNIIYFLLCYATGPRDSLFPVAIKLYPLAWAFEFKYK